MSKKVIYKCDRCGKEIAKANLTTIGYVSNNKVWDLCRNCKSDFLSFMS